LAGAPRRRVPARHRSAVDDALSAIEQENPGLRNVLPRVYARAPVGRTDGLPGGNDRELGDNERLAKEVKRVLASVGRAV
jgi:hypothetical protein